eukprot:sb/3463190/
MLQTVPQLLKRQYAKAILTSFPDSGTDRYNMMMVRVYFRNRPAHVNNQSESLFRSRDWLSANQGPVLPDSVGSWSIFEEMVKTRMSFHTYTLDSWRADLFTAMMMVRVYFRNRPAHVNNQSESLFRSRDLLSANQGPVLVGFCPDIIYLIPQGTDRHTLTTNQNRYLGHVTCYQPIRDQYWSVSVQILFISYLKVAGAEICVAVGTTHRLYSHVNALPRRAPAGELCDRTLMMMVRVYFRNRPAHVNNQSESLFRSRDLLSANQGPVLVGFCPDIIYLIPQGTDRHTLTTNQNRYLGHVTCYQPIRDQYWSVSVQILFISYLKVAGAEICVAVGTTHRLYSHVNALPRRAPAGELCDRTLMMMVRVYFRNRPAHVNNQSESLFRSRDLLSANQGPVLVGFCPDIIYLIPQGTDRHTLTTNQNRYLGHVTCYQPIRDQYWSVSVQILFISYLKVAGAEICVAVGTTHRLYSHVNALPRRAPAGELCDRTLMMMVRVYFRNRPAHVNNQSESLFRSRDLLSANQGPVLVGFCPDIIYLIPQGTDRHTLTTNQNRYLGHVTGYQPIRDQYFLIRSVPGLFLKRWSRQECHFLIRGEQISSPRED